MGDAAAPLTLRLNWRKDLEFEATTVSGSRTILDGNRGAGLSPMENLLASLCACMAIDVVMILQKMRLDLQAVEVSASGERQAEPPRFFHKIELVFTLTGEIPLDRAEHAVALSFERYCSVFHSLRKDMEVNHRVELRP